MKPPIALEYRGHAQDRPGWVTRLGIASIVFGALSATAGVIYVHQSCQYSFDPTIHWYYPPPRWVYPSCLVVESALTGLSVLLVAAGFLSLTKPGVCYRLYLVYGASIVPLVAVMAIVHSVQSFRDPRNSAMDLTVHILAQCVGFGGYPVFILFFILRKMRAKRAEPQAA